MELPWGKKASRCRFQGHEKILLRLKGGELDDALDPIVRGLGERDGEDETRRICGRAPDPTEQGARAWWETQEKKKASWTSASTGPIGTGGRQ